MVLNVSIQWKVMTSHKFNAFAYGKLFKQSNESIVAAGEDGIVQVYEIPSTSPEKSKLSTITVSLSSYAHCTKLLMVLNLILARTIVWQ